MNTAGLGFIVSVHKAGDPELYIYEAKKFLDADPAKKGRSKRTEPKPQTLQREETQPFDLFLLVHLNAASREAFGGPEKVRGRLGPLISEVCLT